MRRPMTLLIAATLLAMTASAPGATARPHAASTERTATADYECPCGTSAAHQSWGVTLEGQNGPTFETKARERYLRISIGDDVAQAVHARVAQDTNPGDLDYELVRHVCTATTDPIEITPSVNVDITIFTGTCDDQETPSSPTRGTVTATFSNVP